MLCLKVNLNKKDIRDVLKFSDEMNIKQKRNGSRDKIRNDIGRNRIMNGIVGKLGEVGAAKLFGGSVDFRVWETGSRGSEQFEPDLNNTTSKYSFHVKTCNLKYTIRKGCNVTPLRSASWTMDKSDPLINRSTEYDIIILMFASTEGLVGCLGYCKAVDLRRLWRPCISRKMLHKKAVYYPDIKSKIIQRLYVK